jgi:excisionase family DNA binding protein
MMPAPTRATLTILEAATSARVSRRTIYNWIAKGDVDVVRTAGGKIRILADSLWRDAKGQRMPAAGS